MFLKEKYVYWRAMPESMQSFVVCKFSVHVLIRISVNSAYAKPVPAIDGNTPVKTDLLRVCIAIFAFLHISVYGSAYYNGCKDRQKSLNRDKNSVVFLDKVPTKILYDKMEADRWHT